MHLPNFPLPSPPPPDALRVHHRWTKIVMCRTLSHASQTSSCWPVAHHWLAQARQAAAFISSVQQAHLICPEEQRSCKQSAGGGGVPGGAGGRCTSSLRILQVAVLLYLILYCILNVVLNRLQEAAACLEALGALDARSGRLTERGRAMARLPVSPRHARMLLQVRCPALQCGASSIANYKG